MTYTFTDNYKADLNRYINELYGGKHDRLVDATISRRKVLRKEGADTSEVESFLAHLIGDKNAIATQLTEAYFAHAGEMPDEKPLSRLADWIFRHELYDRTPYKIANTEYPFMNERMFDERKAKDTGEVAIQAEQERKTVGGRRQRSRYENAFMDRKHKAHNKRLRDRYNAFKRGEGVAVMRVEITGSALPDGYWYADVGAKGSE